MGVPLYRWMVCNGKSIYKWMAEGTPINQPSMVKSEVVIYQARLGTLVTHGDHLQVLRCF